MEEQLGDLILAQKGPNVHVDIFLGPHTVYIKHLHSVVKIGFITVLLSFLALYHMYDITQAMKVKFRITCRTKKHFLNEP